MLLGSTMVFQGVNRYKRQILVESLSLAFGTYCLSALQVPIRFVCCELAGISLGFYSLEMHTMHYNEMCITLDMVLSLLFPYFSILYSLSKSSRLLRELKTIVYNDGSSGIFRLTTSSATIRC